MSHHKLYSFLSWSLVEHYFAWVKSYMPHGGKKKTYSFSFLCNPLLLGFDDLRNSNKDGICGTLFQSGQSPW